MDFQADDGFQGHLDILDAPVRGAVAEVRRATLEVLEAAPQVPEAAPEVLELAMKYKTLPAKPTQDAMQRVDELVLD